MNKVSDTEIKQIIAKKILFVYNNADIFLNSIIGIQLILIVM